MSPGRLQPHFPPNPHARESPSPHVDATGCGTLGPWGFRWTEGTEAPSIASHGPRSRSVTPREIKHSRPPGLEQDFPASSYAARDGVRIELLVDSSQFCSRLSEDLATARGYVLAQALSFEGDAAGNGMRVPCELALGPLAGRITELKLAALDRLSALWKRALPPVRVRGN